MLFINGKFGTTPLRHEPAAVVGKFSMPGLLKTQRLVVTSWREGREVNMCWSLLTTITGFKWAIAWSLASRTA